MALVIERFFKIPQKVKESNWLVKLAGIIITLHVWAFSMIFFRAQTFEKGIQVISQIFNYFHPEVFIQFVEGYTLVFILLVIGYFTHYLPQSLDDYLQRRITNLPLIGKAVLVAVVIWIVAQFKTTGIQPFIYFQF